MEAIRDWLGVQIVGIGFLIMTDEYFDGIIEQIRKEHLTTTNGKEE